MPKFWMVLLKTGLQIVVNALSDRDAKEHVKRDLGVEDDAIEDCSECIDLDKMGEDDNLTPSSK